MRQCALLTGLLLALWLPAVCVCGCAGVPPCVLSFVHAPGVPHALPSATHTDVSSLWEEPCLAFVRLVVSTVNLGPAAAAATQSARLSGPAGGSSSGGGGGSSAAAAGGSGGGGRRKGSKVVLRRLTGLLKGDAAAAEVGWRLWCCVLGGAALGSLAEVWWGGGEPRAWTGVIHNAAAAGVCLFLPPDVHLPHTISPRAPVTGGCCCSCCLLI